MIIFNGMFGMDGGVGHYTWQRYNEKVQSNAYYYLPRLSHIISNFHVDVFDNNKSNAISHICLDLIYFWEPYKKTYQKDTQKIAIRKINI